MPAAIRTQDFSPEGANDPHANKSGDVENKNRLPKWIYKAYIIIIVISIAIINSNSRIYCFF